MKKVAAFLLVVVLSVSVSIAYIYGFFDIFDNTISGEFNVRNHPFMTDKYVTMMDNYSHAIDLYGIEPYFLENISKPSQLRREAQKIWIKEYGVRIRKEQPYEVFFDPENNVWLIQGSFENIEGVATFGGNARMIVDAETGRVLALWHE